MTLTMKRTNQTVPFFLNTSICITLVSPLKLARGNKKITLLRYILTLIKFCLSYKNITGIFVFIHFNVKMLQSVHLNSVPFV